MMHKSVVLWLAAICISAFCALPAHAQTIRRGACCIANNQCVVVSKLNCTRRAGTFKGVNSVCTPQLCAPQPIRGACCVDGGCAVIMRIGCTARHGIFQGANSVCSPNPCATAPAGTGPTGACCSGTGMCSILTSNACAGQGGMYMGNGVPCGLAPCVAGAGACCVNGACQLATQASCGSIGGVFKGVSTACASVACVQPVGACCAGVAACQVLTAAQCDAVSGRFIGPNAACAGIACIPGLGACCTGGSNGANCSLVLATDCIAYSGSFRGEGSLCVPGNCPTIAAEPQNACCLPGGGGCTVTGRSDCLLRRGAFYYSTTCAQVNCSIDLGGCCAPGYCNVTTLADCTELGGTWNSTKGCNASFCGGTCACDWDRNGFVNVNDLFAFMNAFLLGLGDFNENGSITDDDAREFIGCLLMYRDQPCP